MADDKRVRCFMDVSMDGNAIGRIIFELFVDITPKTCENFRQLCTGEPGFGYKGSTFHRIIRNFMLQAGDFTNHNGTGGKSIYGEKFEDENFIRKHEEPYLLSMANAGPGTNGSQFFITTVNTPHLDGKHVVFGKAIKGFGTIKRLEGVSVKGDSPKVRCEITDCGELQHGEDDGMAPVNDGTGDNFPILPEDYEGLTTALRIKISADLKAIGNEQYKAKNFELAIKKYEKSLVYLNRQVEEEEKPDSDSDSEPEKEEKSEVEKKCDEKQGEVNVQECAILLNMSMCHLLVKNNSKADNAARRAIKADPKNPKGYFRLARALSASKEYDSALKELATAASLAPEDRAITKEQQAIKAAQKKYNEGEKKKFAKMFG